MLSPSSALLLGTDSLVVSAAISPLLCSTRSKVALAVLFGVFDGAATFVGATAGWRLPSVLTDQVVAVLLGLYGAYILVIARWGLRMAARWPIWVMPALMSLDNLAYGFTRRHQVGIGRDAVILAMSSALMAGIGLVVGRLLVTTVRRRAQWVAGAAMAVAASVLLVT